MGVWCDEGSMCGEGGYEGVCVVRKGVKGCVVITEGSVNAERRKNDKENSESQIYLTICGGLKIYQSI